MIPGIGLGPSAIKLLVIDKSNSILEESTFQIDVS